MCLPRLDRGLEMLRVQVDRRGDQHRVDLRLRQQFAIVAVDRGAFTARDLRLPAIDPVLENVADGRQARAGGVRHVRADIHAAPARADDAKRYRRVRLISESRLRLRDQESGGYTRDRLTSADEFHSVFLLPAWIVTPLHSMHQRREGIV